MEIMCIDIFFPELVALSCNKGKDNNYQLICFVLQSTKKVS